MPRDAEPANSWIPGPKVLFVGNVITVNIVILIIRDTVIVHIVWIRVVGISNAIAITVLYRLLCKPRDIRHHPARENLVAVDAEVKGYCTCIGSCCILHNINIRIGNMPCVADGVILNLCPVTKGTVNYNTPRAMEVVAIWHSHCEGW
jgi:hypothetical protein